MRITQVVAPDIWDPGEHLFAQCVHVSDVDATLYLAGQTSIDADGKIVGPGDAPLQIETCFDNIERLVTAAGGGLDSVVRLRAYFTDMASLPTYTAILGRRFRERRPSQTVVQVVALVVELEAVAVL
jgi:2-iminobutanoate/2-iminopropanoate deaminase